MIKSKTLFFSPIHRNYKIDILLILLYLNSIGALLYLNVVLSVLILSFIFIFKVEDFYSIIENEKNKLSNFKIWLNFINTNFYKKIMKFMYVYFIFSIFYITFALIYYFNTDSYLQKGGIIVLLITLLLHLLGTFLKFKKIQT